MPYMASNLKTSEGMAALKKIGKTIVELRKKKKDFKGRPWSQDEFADQVGVHRTFAGSIERGETNLSFLNILRIANALDVKPSELLKKAGY